MSSACDPPLGLSLAHISPLLPTPATLSALYAGPELSGSMEVAAQESADRYIDAPWTADGETGLMLPSVPGPELQIARRGNLMRLQGRTESGGQMGGGKRGKVAGLSRQARARLMRLVASIDRTYPASLWLFVTLTYPAEYPTDATTYHRHLDSWFKRLFRDSPDAAAIWKCEYQRRGAPHFHILLFGRAFLDRHWLSKSWYDVVGSGDVNHLAAGTQIKAVRSWGGVTHYAAKYVAKTETATNAAPTGRLWGIRNRAALPIEVLDLPLLWAEFHCLRRLMRRLAGGVKPQPWCPRPPTARRPWSLKARSGGQGATLFVAERVAVRLLRALSGGWQIDADDPPTRRKSSFWHWAG